MLLATTTLGAILTSTAPEMGARGIAERFIQVRPKVMFIESEVVYGGKRRNLQRKFANAIAEMKAQACTVNKIVLVNGKSWDKENMQG